MTNLFDYFDIDPTLISKKAKLKIFIMGPYSPESAKRRVEDLRDFLVEEGYCAKTAENFDDTGQELTDKEIFEKCRKLLLEWAHGRLFLFLKDALFDSKLIGVYDEFVTATENIPRKEHYTCAVFLEEGLEERVSTMMRGRLEHFSELTVYRFSNDDELHDMATSFCFNLLIRMHERL